MPALAEDKPWERGVPEARRKAALISFRAGNEHFEESRYREALVEYRNSVTAWDHPAIHFNIAVCLINLDQPVEAQDHLQAAMKYGEAPLGKALHAQGETYRKLLDGRLARLLIKASQEGVAVTLDGKDLFVGPDQKELIILPGPHQLVAKKTGLAPLAKKLSLQAGVLTTEEVVLVPPQAVPVRLERRWKAWIPWVVTTSGAVVGLAGAGVFMLSRPDFKRYDEDIERLCPDGCADADIPASVKSIYDRAKMEQTIGVAGMAVGGAVVVGGLTMVFLNQPRAIEAGPEITPVIGPEGASVQLRLHF